MTPGAMRSTEELVGGDGALVVDGLTECVDHAADHGVADGHAHDLAGALDLVAFLDLGVIAEQHGADLIFFEVHGQAGDAVREREQFAGHDLVEAVNAGDAVADGDDGADFIDGDLGFVVLDLLTNELGNLVCLDLGHMSPVVGDQWPSRQLRTKRPLHRHVIWHSCLLLRAKPSAKHCYEFASCSFSFCNCPRTEPS